MDDSKPSSDTFLRPTNSLDDGCTAPSTGSGDVCGERSGLQILSEFRKLYEGRIAGVDTNDEEGPMLKMKIMEEWIRDLDAQNVMLVKTVEELEEAAYQRVKILEDKLRQTSNLISDNMSRLEQPTHHRLNDLTERLDCLEHEQEFFKQKIHNLQSDITGLLELIRRAYYEHRWSLEGISLCELKYTDIPIPFDDDGDPQEYRSSGNKDLTEHEEFKLLSGNEKIMSNQEESIDLREELEEKQKEMERLLDQLRSLEKEALETREALTLEVADKHDQTIILKEQMANLEDQCRQADMQKQFKDDIIRGMRGELKQLQKKGSPPPTSGQLKKCSRVTWNDAAVQEVVNEDESTNDKDEGEPHDLRRVKDILIEILQTFNNHRTRAYEKGLADAHEKVRDMESLLENYNIQTLGEESDFNAFISHTSQLAEAIEIISRVCLERDHRVQCGVCEGSNERSSAGENNSLSSERSPSISREDFKMLEEFRMCTVEAQAAVEDLQEEMISAVENLSRRHQLFTDLKIPLENIHQQFTNTSDDLQNVMRCLMKHIEEKLVTRETIATGEMRLKDLKNRMNECLVEKPRDRDPLVEEKLSTADRGQSFSTCLMDNVVEEIEYILCNINVFVSKEESTCQLLRKCRDQLQRTQCNFDELRQLSDDALRGNDSASDAYEEKSKRLAKLERELDNAHTRMQDNLEEIVRRRQLLESNRNSWHDRSESSGYNQCRESNHRLAVEIQQLRNSVTSRDKLIERKDEIIKNQRDSIFATQQEMKDLQDNYQRQIEANAASVNDHLEERKKLLKQSNLQTETIQHLQEAVVEAKKCLDRQSGQKSGGDVWTTITPTVFSNGDVHDI